jgi:aspartate carbamoyltransferase catalytic subunit
MPRHLIDIADMSNDDVAQLFGMADEGPLPESLAGMTCLAVFFQESTRTRLGFMSAAARQGASVLDAGRADRLRLEPQDDQLMVLAEIAHVAVVRHWNASFASGLAARERCCVVNAGAGDASHPTQSLIDAYTLTKAFGRDIKGLRVFFLGPLLRSAVSFRELAPMLGVDMLQRDVATNASRDERLRYEAELRTADVIYVQSLSKTSYSSPDLNNNPRGPALPDWVLEAILASDARIMHALPRGPELPDRLMRNQRSLVSRQVELGLPVRSAVLRWLVHPS